MGVTSRLAGFISGRRFEDLSPEAVEVSKHCMLDYMGVTMAGANEPLVKIIREQVAEEGGAPQASLFAGGTRVSLVQAALVNGTASHTHDYDDVHNAIFGHPTVPVAPAAFALAEWRGASGRDLILALATGIDTECMLGQYLGSSHYARGFHATATMGTFGSAAASARLLGLDVDKTSNALGISATQASGLKSMFGTMCKPFHAGKAASNGLLSAMLAARGFDSQPLAVEGDQGFGPTHADSLSEEAFDRAMASASLVPETLFKYHAACYLTHSAMEAAAYLKETHGFVADDIAGVEITVNKGHFAVCNIQEPTTALEAKFSLRQAAAMVLSGVDTSSINEFTDEVTREPELVRLRDRIVVSAFPAPGHVESLVSIRLESGEEYSREWNVAIPETDLELQRNRLGAKFDALVSPVMGDARAIEIRELALHLDEMQDITPLCDLVRGDQASQR